MECSPEMTEPPKATDTLQVLEPDALDNPESSTLSPVAARKEHFENIFRKQAPSLTSPSEFKHYEPGSLVKKRHSWLQDEIIDNKKPLEPSLKYQFKSPLLRRLVQKRSKTPPCETDNKNSEEGAEYKESRDEHDENKVQATSNTQAAEEKTNRDMAAVGIISSSQSSSHGTETLQGANGADQGRNGNPLDIFVAIQPHELESSSPQQDPTAPIDEIEITVSSTSFGEVRDQNLNVSALETDERGDDVAMVAAKRQQNEKSLRRTMQQEKLKAAQRRHRKLKRGDSDEPKVAAENPVPAMSTEASNANHVVHMQTIAIMPRTSHDYDEWQMVRVNSQSCDARCLDAVSCTIL